MNSSEHVIDRLRKFFHEQLGRMSVGAKDSLVNSGLIDSLSIVTLILFIDVEFQVTLEYEDMTAENFDTLERISTLVVSRSATLS